MISKTKFELDDATVKKLFDAAGINGVKDIAPLGAGEFNAVYSAKAGDKEYVLKVAPRRDTPVLPYEEDMMQAEVYWYKAIRENTDIRVPQVYFTDYNGSLVAADYFIMEKMAGFHPNKKTLSAEELADCNANMAVMCAKIHRIKHDKFGYIQNGLHDNWYQAIRSMTVNILNSGRAKGHRLRRGYKLLNYIDAYRDILEKVECSMVNYDLWAANIIVNRTEKGMEYCWIDPERSFWGDRVADFVCLDYMNTLANKKEAIAAYNSAAETPLIVNRYTEVRYGIMMAYMGLIQDTEKYFRYSPTMFGWWRNIVSCKVFYDKGFKILRKYRYE